MQDEFDDPDPEEIRHVLRQVEAHRRIAEQVRKKATGTIIYGFIMLGFWYFLDGQRGRFDLFSLAYLGIGILELSVGLLNRFFPTVTGILLDALVLLAFAVSNGVRAYYGWTRTGVVDPVMAVFGAYMAFQSFNIVRSYIQIRRAMPARPSIAQMRWLGGLVKELRNADPKSDPRALAMPTDPFLTALLLGDNAFLLDEAQQVMIVGRKQLTLDREEPRNPVDPPIGYLMIEGVAFRPFKLGDSNWANYVAWKREGGEEV